MFGVAEVTTYLQTSLGRVRFLRLSSIVACLPSGLAASLAYAPSDPAYRPLNTLHTFSSSHYACPMTVMISLVGLGVWDQCVRKTRVED